MLICRLVLIINILIFSGMAHLHGYTLHDSSKKFSFTLKPPEPQMKPFTFAADNETDKNR